MASIVQRINDLLKADLHHWLDGAEEPERMLKQAVRELENHLREARLAVVRAVAGEKILLQQLQHHRAQSKDWADRAEYALRQGQEALARMALTRKLDCDRIAGDLQSSWTAARQTSERLQEQLKALEANRAEICRRRLVLAARQRAAKAQCALSGTAASLRGGLEIQDRFARLEERVAAAEAQAQAVVDVLDEPPPLEQAFQALENQVEVERELNALKEKIKIYPSRGEW